MRIDLLVAEIGSTTTVVHGFDRLGGERPRILGQGRALTTVEEGDIYIGVERALDHLAEQVGTDHIDAHTHTAASSAAGGLRMSVHGLAYDMTVRAAREAALGAGAVVKMVTAGKMTARQLQNVVELKPNLILLAGGVDFGDEDVPWHNAQAIAKTLTDHDLAIPVIYAGNVVLQDDIERLLSDQGIPVFLCDNVYPRIDQLVVEPARRVIHEVFEEHIITAPGMDKVKDQWGRVLWPTPAAVMRSALLFQERQGDVVVVDVGGATTDVHSVTLGSPEVQDISSAPEPKAKRTVEGDLGVFINSKNVIQLRHYRGWNHNGEHPPVVAIPETDQQRQWVLELTEAAAREAVLRHVGRYMYHYDGSGRKKTASGRDLTAVQYLIGTGGIFAHLDAEGRVLENCLRGGEELLLPKHAQILTDKKYIMAAVGTVVDIVRDDAWKLLERSFF